MIGRATIFGAIGAVLGIAGTVAALPLLTEPQGTAAVVAVAAPPPISPTIEAPAVADDIVPVSREQVQLSFAPVVKAVTPSVVNVYATTMSAQSASPFASDPFFQQFFGGNAFRTVPREEQSLGSGVIIDPSGIIVTNNHVVNGATDIRVATSDGREYPVDLVLNDARTDLAVLRVRDPGGVTFPALAFGDSDALEVGDLVLAIGNPFGVGQTVTSGIVSALARTGVESSDYEFFIQTDAAINPGNSGGALVDLQGRLVGINTAIFTRSGGSVGIGFAVPARMAQVVTTAAISGDPLTRPWLGARLQAVTSDLAASLGLDRVRGALVSEVATTGAAQSAGLVAGDVITSIDGMVVQQPTAVLFRLATLPIGSTARIEVFRNGQSMTLDLPVEATPSGTAASVTGNTRFAGTTVETITPASAEELGLPFAQQGVVVRAIEPRSPAEQMGLKVGDVILNLNGRDMNDAQTFESVASARPDGWQVVLQRGGRTFRSYVSG